MNNTETNKIKTFLKACIIGIGYLFFATSVHAQIEDFQLRLGLSADGDLVHNFSWNFDLQQRFKQNIEAFDQFLVEPGVRYSPLPFLKVGVGYRLVYLKTEERNVEFKQRMHAEAKLSTDIMQWKLNYRTRFQYGFDDFSSPLLVTNNSFVQRHLFEVSYAIFGTRWKPSLTFEAYHHLNHLEGTRISRLKYVAGTDFLVSVQTKISAFYMINQELNEANPNTNYIVGVSYSYSF